MYIVTFFLVFTHELTKRLDPSNSTVTAKYINQMPSYKNTLNLTSNNYMLAFEI